MRGIIRILKVRGATPPLHQISSIYAQRQFILFHDVNQCLLNNELERICKKWSWPNFKWRNLIKKTSQTGSRSTDCSTARVGHIMLQVKYKGFILCTNSISFHTLVFSAMTMKSRCPLVCGYQSVGGMYHHLLRLISVKLGK